MITNISYVDTFENEKALVIDCDEISVRMNSSVSPTYEAERWAMQFSDNIMRVYLLFGIGTGIFIHKFLKQINSESIVIACEPDRGIADAGIDNLKKHGTVFKNLFFCKGENWVSQFAAVVEEKVTPEMINGIKVIVLPKEERVYPDDLIKFMKYVLTNRDRIRSNVHTENAFKLNRVVNLFKNKGMYRGAYFAKDLSKVIPTDVPIIIVAAGPSLDKNVEELRRAKGHSVIIAVDTALPILMSKGIIPDVTISVDANKDVNNYRDVRCHTIPIILSEYSTPGIVSNINAAIFLAECDGFIARALLECGVDVPASIESGGSVATSAFSVAYYCEVSNVVLIGQDLAYSGEFTHAGGVVSAGVRREEGQEYIEGVDGQPVRTRGDWLDYLRWFEMNIPILNRSKAATQVIDATEGGALIHGSHIMTLKEAVDSLCNVDFDFANAICSMTPAIDEECYKSFVKRLNETPKHLTDIADKAKKGSQACDRLLDGHGTNDDGSMLVLLKSEIEGASEYSIIHGYIMFDVVDEMARLRLAGGEAREQTLNTVRSYKLFFDNVAAAGTELAGLIQEELDEE